MTKRGDGQIGHGTPAGNCCLGAVGDDAGNHRHTPGRHIHRRTGYLADLVRGQRVPLTGAPGDCDAVYAGLIDQVHQFGGQGRQVNLAGHRIARLLE